MGKNKTKKTQNEMMERQSFQENESYPSMETGLPQDRFQATVQTASASQTSTKGKDFVTTGDTPESSSIVARTATAVKKKVSIKPTSDTGLDEGNIVGGVPLGDSGVQRSVAGALPIGISNDQSRVPYTNGGVRPTERYGKKISTDNFIINNVVSEQIDPSFDEPKDLRESPNALQGYNGRKQFKSARGKKVYGTHPGATLYERSVDFAGHSTVVSTSGQVLNSVNRSSNYPVNTTDGDDHYAIVHKGNFLLNSFNMVIEDGRIERLYFDETEIVVPDPMEAIDQANMNWQVDANNVAKAMVKMQTELGRETTEKWSPLGYVIDQPYQFGMLFHDGEATLGALTGAAYKSAAHSLAFLQNKMAKEGVRGLSSIAEWLNEDIALATSSNFYTTSYTAGADIFSRTELLNGSAAAIIAMFDSTSKYSTKADFINQQRSFKFHLQTVDNNINPFHAKKEFYKALDKSFLFSTEDGQYNPVLPIHVTDEVKVMVPYSMQAWLKDWKNPKYKTIDAGNNHKAFFNETGICNGCSYRYSDIRNEYAWEYVDPFIAGLCRWILRHEANIIKTYGTNATVRLPIHFTNTTGNMFNFMVCSASQDMAWMRNLIFRDYLFAGEQGVYVWEDLASLKELNPVYASQYNYVDYASALKLGTLSSASKVRLFWPESIVVREARRENDHVASYYLPFYFNEEGINPSSTDGIDPAHGGVMSYPLVRNGVNHEYVDIAYALSERDFRLCLDRMVTIPVGTRFEDGVVTGYHNASDYHYSSLRYDENSDGRVIMTAKEASTLGLHEWTYIATPRELGFLFPAPVNILKPIHRSGDESLVEKELDAYITGAKGDYITSYHAYGDVTNGRIIDRSASLSQEWIRCIANPFCRDDNSVFVSNTGIVPSLSCFIDATLEEEGNGVNTSYSLVNPSLFTIPALYNLQSDNLENVSDDVGDLVVYVGNNTVFSMAKFMWSMIQRVYAPINPFDSAWLNIGDQGATPPLNDGVVTDPLESAMYFGFAGTLASDFNQDILERLNIKDQLGMYYYQDEFIKSSLIFN